LPHFAPGFPLRAALCCAGLLATSAAAEPRRVFVSSAYGPADFAQWSAATPGTVGVDAADSICRALAAQAALPNAGAFRAWLSSAADDAWCRVQNLPGTRDTACAGAPAQPGGGPWARTGDGARWSGPLAALTDQQGPLLPLDRDEHGTLVPDYELHWTGTDASGRAIGRQATALCDDWTSAAADAGSALGSTFATRVGWTHSFAGSCADHRRLVCVETGVGPWPPVASIGPAALAFVTAAAGNGNFASWPLAEGRTGLEAADFICRREAMAARLPRPHSFVAWLSSATRNARDRLPAALGWRRLDGTGLAASRDDLIDGWLAAPPNQTGGGAYLPLPPAEAAPVWTGTAWDGMGLAGMTCGDWGSAAMGDAGLAGFGNSVASDWTDGQPFSCDALLPLYCFSTAEILFWGSFESGDTGDWSPQT
jgi:hypothetical protein